VIDLSVGDPIQTERTSPKKATTPSPSSATQPVASTGPRTVRWSAPASAMTGNNRFKGRLMNANGIRLVATVVDYPEFNFTRVDLDISNGTGQPINVDPATVTWATVQPQSKQVKQVDPMKLAHSIELDDYTASQADVLHGGGGMMNAGMGGGRSVSQSQRTIQYGDQSYGFTQFLRETRLKKGELIVGQRVVGGVYFQRVKNAQETLLRVPVGEITFEIPYKLEPGH
jgi:hypothetical protein